MILTDDQAKQFYRLWIPLLDYVNKKYHIVKKLYGMTSPKGLPSEAVQKISAKLWENTDVIDEFIESGCAQLGDEEIQIIRSWKKAVSGKFIVDRHLKKGSVLISLEDEEVYVVKGIYSSWRELLERFPMPQIVQATLIPFQGVIIHDGVIMPYGVCLGKHMSDRFRQIYREAKESGKVHFDL